MSFFNIKEAIEEYIEEYTLQAKIAKKDFGYEIFINDNNQLIIKLLYQLDDSGMYSEDCEFTKELEILKFDYDVVLSHYEEEALNEFLEDALPHVLPKLIEEDEANSNFFLYNLFKEYSLCNGEIYKPSSNRVNSVLTATMPQHSHKSSYYINALMAQQALIDSYPPPLYISHEHQHPDPRQLTFKVLKNRSSSASSNTIMLWDELKANMVVDDSKVIMIDSIIDP